MLKERPHSSKLFCTDCLGRSTCFLHFSTSFFYMKKQTASALLVIYSGDTLQMLHLPITLYPTVAVKSVCCQTVVACQSLCLFGKIWKGFGGCRWHNTTPQTLLRAAVLGEMGRALVVSGCLEIEKPLSVPMLILLVLLGLHCQVGVPIMQLSLHSAFQ